MSLEHSSFYTLRLTVLAFSLVIVEKTENISAYTLDSYKYSVILRFMQINGLLITRKITCYVKPVGNSTNLKEVAVA